MPEAKQPKWIVNVFGKAGADSWEISVVKSKYKRGRESYGWFGRDKILIGHNGGPCRDAVRSDVWCGLILLAFEICERLNSGGRVR